MAFVLSRAQDSHKDLESQQAPSFQLISGVMALMRLRSCYELLAACQRTKARSSTPYCRLLTKSHCS